MGFNYCEYNGGTVSWDGTDVGFIKDVTFTSNIETESLKTSGGGGPLKLRGKKAKEYVCQLKAQLFEVSNPNNMALLLGGGAAPVADSGSPVTVTKQALTFAERSNQGIESVVLDGGTISTGGDKPVVLSADELTTYDENDDYIVDYDNGVIYLNPGGSISSGDVVKVTYKHTPAVGHTIPLGSTFALARKPLVFSHLNEDEDIITRITFWQAEPDGKANFVFSDGAFVMPEITWDAIDDTANHPTQPFGKIQFLNA